MDSKNTIAAIALSSAVIVLYSLFFVPEKSSTGQNPVEKEKTISYVLDLSDMALAIGDVITYMALALDNKEPEGQIARSEVYFIEILPPEGNSTESDAEMEGEQKEIPVRDFINKTKKIKDWKKP